MTRLLAVPLDASDVFLMTFMILQDSYMEPTRVGSDIYHIFLVLLHLHVLNIGLLSHYTLFSKPCSFSIYTTIASNSYIPPTFSSENVFFTCFLYFFYNRLWQVTPPPTRFNYRHEQTPDCIWDHCTERWRILTRRLVV